ncbi:atp-dependent RNA helicase ddx5-related [Anaeramoeba ignava]|uniref:RNA helicase n=1 Tax=Anaeramoeba ignava TaxID=1746090 RepID=A0A9Q0RH53_ANAIG|nr:atp-dependent RNA helicase ddx5-related [Anaeramoeba ignava]
MDPNYFNSYNAQINPNYTQMTGFNGQYDLLNTMYPYGYGYNIAQTGQQYTTPVNTGDQHIQSTRRGEENTNIGVSEGLKRGYNEQQPSLGINNPQNREEEKNRSTLSQIGTQRPKYQEHTGVKNLTNEQVRKYREEQEITVLGDETEGIGTKPIISFDQTPFPQIIVDKLYNRGWKTPTPIQSQGWPIVLSGNDFIGVAETGSGKTLAFLLPAFEHIRAESGDNKYRSGPVVLVLAPTRELAKQIKEVCDEFGSVVGIHNACVYGGIPKIHQIDELRRNPHVIIATPGRLIDFLDSGETNMRSVSYLVLDEADRMLDMGFEPQIRRILSQIVSKKQTLLWSATWPKDVQKLAHEFLYHPIRVNIGSLDLSANKNVTQIVDVVPNFEKKIKFKNLLAQIRNDGKILVFVDTKVCAEELANELKSDGFPVLSIHGDKSQHQREYVLRSFRKGFPPILIATDVASRGLDVKDIKYVINYDFPKRNEDYVHRIGRTARAGKKGVAYSFFTADSAKQASNLIKILIESEQKVNPQLYQFVSQKKNSRSHFPNKNNPNSYHGLNFHNKPQGNYFYNPYQNNFSSQNFQFQNESSRHFPTKPEDTQFENPNAAAVINPILPAWNPSIISPWDSSQQTNTTPNISWNSTAIQTKSSDENKLPTETQPENKDQELNSKKEQENKEQELNQLDPQLLSSILNFYPQNSFPSLNPPIQNLETFNPIFTQNPNPIQNQNENPNPIQNSIQNQNENPIQNLVQNLVQNPVQNPIQNLNESISRSHHYDPHHSNHSYSHSDYHSHSNYPHSHSNYHSHSDYHSHSHHSHSYSHSHHSDHSHSRSDSRSRRKRSAENNEINSNHSDIKTHRTHTSRNQTQKDERK